MHESFDGHPSILLSTTIHALFRGGIDERVERAYECSASTAPWRRVRIVGTQEYENRERGSQGIFLDGDADGPVLIGTTAVSGLGEPMDLAVFMLRDTVEFLDDRLDGVLHLFVIIKIEIVVLRVRVAESTSSLSVGRDPVLRNCTIEAFDKRGEF